MFRVVGLLLVCALSACAQAQLEHQSDSFNRAAATAINEQVLLNAVRSSLDLPPSFTKLQKFTAGGMANGSFSPKLPFGFSAPRSYDLGPSLNWSAGVSTIEYLDINNASALAKLNEDVPYTIIDRYLGQGIEPRVLDTLFTEYLEIDGEFMGAMLKQRKKNCSGNRYSINAATCDALDRTEALCKDALPTASRGLQLPGGRVVYSIGNRAQTKCDFLAFQFTANLLRLMGFYADSGTETTYEKVKAEDGKTVVVPKRKPALVIWFEDPEIQEQYKKLDSNRLTPPAKRPPLPGKPRQAGERSTAFQPEKAIKAKPDQAETKLKDRPIIAYNFRSPKSLLTYLGELIALQNYARHPFIPQVLQGDGRPLTLFRVIRGDAHGPIALGVRGPDGASYVVPQPEYGSHTRNQTVRVLTIASEVINGAISEKDFPPPASVVVRSIQ